MKNFINTRLQAHNNTKIMNNIKHNLRSIQSLNTDLNSTSNNYCFINDKTYKLNEENKIKLLQELKQQYKNDRLIHNEVFKKNNKRNLVDQGTWQEGVFTFSEQLVVDLKNGVYTLNDLSKVANDCLKDIAKAYGADIKAMFLHLDEKTPHFHFFITNFDKEKGFSLFNHFKKKEFLSGIQDIAAKHFSKLGMERGLSKEITTMNHKSINSYWRDKNIQVKQQNQQLLNGNKQLQKENDLLINHINRNNEILNILNGNKINITNEISNMDNKMKKSKELRKKVVKKTYMSNNKKKEIYKKIDNAQEQYRNNRKILVQQKNEIEEQEKIIQNNTNTIKTKKTLDFQKLDIQFNNDINKIINSSKTIFGFDKNNLINSIKEVLKKYTRYDILVNENEELIKEVTKQDTKIKTLVNRNDTLEDTNTNILIENQNIKINEKKLNTKVLNLEKEIEELKKENSKYKDFINKNDLVSNFDTYNVLEENKTKSKNNSNKFGR